MTDFLADRVQRNSNDGTSWETAIKTIQEGIDKALEGDTVTVAQAVYSEKVQFNGKNIVLRSTDPLDPATVASTVIEGDRMGTVVTFAGTENESCVLSGFTIRNGSRGISGGGTHAIIENNVISENSGTDFDAAGGGLCGCDGIIRNNVVSRNSVGFGFGAGLYKCQGTIIGNIIERNGGADFGGGLMQCNGTICRNIISGNHANFGGGLYDCDGLIQSNLIIGNWVMYDGAGEGGGLGGCDGSILNHCCPV